MSKLQEVLFREVLVLIKEKVVNGVTRTGIVHFINSWIWTIDDIAKRKKDETTKKNS